MHWLKCHNGKVCMQGTIGVNQVRTRLIGDVMLTCSRHSHSKATCCTTLPFTTIHMSCTIADYYPSTVTVQ
eukprot:3324650-Amphidinium_carterae.1